MEKLSKDELRMLFGDLVHVINLQRGCYEPARDFLVQNINRKWKTVDVRGKLSSADLKNRHPTAAILGFCAWFYSELELIGAYYASLSEEEKKLIGEATWVTSVPWQRINELFAAPAVGCETSRQSHGGKFSFLLDGRLERWQDFIKYTPVWDANNAKDFLTRTKLHFELPLALRKSFAAVLPKPEGYELKPCTLKKNEMIFSAEEAIFREIPLLLTHYLQGNIRYSQKGYPVLSSCNKVSRLLQLSEFPGNDQPGLRAMLLSAILYDRVNMETASLPPLEILRQLFTDDPQDGCPIPVLIDYLKGARNLYEHQCDDEVTLAVLQLCSEMNTTDWFSLEKMRAHLNTHLIEFKPLSFYYLSKLSYQKEGREQQVERTEMEQRVYKPAFAAHFYWLAACGLMDLAIDCRDPCPYSWYDGLRACRLTALGAYLLGMQKEYTPRKSKSDVRLTFDEHNLVITAEGNLMLADTMLSNYAVRAGANHYQFSPGKFLTDCHSADELKKKIALFKRTAGGQLPPLWEKTLKRMRENSGTISPKRDMRIYELPAGDRELHRLVARDQQLRAFIIKAERFHVLVAESDASRFKDRMKELGYLID